MVVYLAYEYLDCYSTASTSTVFLAAPTPTTSADDLFYHCSTLQLIRCCTCELLGHSHLHAPAANRLAGADVLSRVFGCGNHETHLHLRWIWLRGGGK